MIRLITAADVLVEGKREVTVLNKSESPFRCNRRIHPLIPLDGNCGLIH